MVICIFKFWPTLYTWNVKGLSRQLLGSVPKATSVSVSISTPVTASATG